MTSPTQNTDPEFPTAELGRLMVSSYKPLSGQELYLRFIRSTLLWLCLRNTLDLVVPFRRPLRHISLYSLLLLLA